MTTELAACEFEDSTNCIWNAQEQGNGVGESFIDIEGETFYIPEIEDIEVPEAIESVGVSPTPPEKIDTGVLAETGSVDIITGLLLGVALVASGVVALLKGRKVA